MSEPKERIIRRAQCASKAKTRLTEKYRAEYQTMYAEELTKAGLILSDSGRTILELQEEVARLTALLEAKESVSAPTPFTPIPASIRPYVEEKTPIYCVDPNCEVCEV